MARCFELAHHRDDLGLFVWYLEDLYSSALSSGRKELAAGLPSLRYLDAASGNPSLGFAVDAESGALMATMVRLAALESAPNFVLEFESSSHALYVARCGDREI